MARGVNYKDVTIMVFGYYCRTNLPISLFKVIKQWESKHEDAVCSGGVFPWNFLKTTLKGNGTLFCGRRLKKSHPLEEPVLK